MPIKYYVVDHNNTLWRDFFEDELSHLDSAELDGYVNPQAVRNRANDDKATQVLLFVHPPEGLERAWYQFARDNSSWVSLVLMSSEPQSLRRYQASNIKVISRRDPENNYLLQRFIKKLPTLDLFWLDALTLPENLIAYYLLLLFLRPKRSEPNVFAKAAEALKSGALRDISNIISDPRVDRRLLPLLKKIQQDPSVENIHQLFHDIHHPAQATQ